MDQKFNMIKNFPGSDDSRGIVTRVRIAPEDEVGVNFSPVMRVDELQGVLGDALRAWNMVKYTANSCQIATVNSIKNLTNILTTENYLDDFNTSVAEIEASINTRISQECTSLAIDPAYFYIKYVDILKTYIQTSGLHNDAGNHTVFVSLNWDLILYGQFSPNVTIEPEPAPEPCACFTPLWLKTKDFGNTNNNGTLVVNSDNTTGVPQVLGHIYVKACGAAFLNANAYATTPQILTAGNFYTLKYDITANQIPILTPGTNMECTIKVNSVIVGIFPLDTIAKSGYMQFQAPLPGGNPYTTFEFIYSKSFGDRAAYPSNEMWACKFELCNASCQNVMP